jgi:hypothetical protein
VSSSPDTSFLSAGRSMYDMRRTYFAKVGIYDQRRVRPVQHLHAEKQQVEVKNMQLRESQGMFV